MILYYVPFVQQISIENVLAAQALRFGHGQHLQHQNFSCKFTTN